MNQERFPYGRTALMSFGYFTNNLTWSAYNVYVPFFLSVQFQDILGPDAKIINTLVAIVMILDNVASIIIQPYIGQRSDKTWINKLGRRMPFVILGIPLAAFFFGLIGSYQNTLWVLLVAICGFNISMAFYKSPVMSLIPDTLPKEYRSQGSGVLNVVGSIASIIGLIIVSTLVKNESPMAFWVNSIIMLVCLVILVLSVKESKYAEIEKSEERLNMFKVIKNTFREGDGTLILMLIAIFLYTAGYTVAEAYISRYVADVLGFGASTSGFILAFFVGFSILLALPAGLIGRRIGALNACVVGAIGFIISVIPITIISMTSIGTLRDLFTLNTLTAPYVEWTTPFYLIMIGLLGFSWLVLSINAIVVIWNMAPKRKTATYTSYFYVFLHLAHILSPLLAGVLFDSYGSILSNNGQTDRSGLEILWIYVTVCFVISFVLILIVKIRKTIMLKKIEDTDEYILKTLEEKEYPLLFLPTLLFGFGFREERALLDLRLAQIKERRKHRREIRLLQRERRKLKTEVLIGDYTEDKEKQTQAIKEQKELGKDMRKDHKEKRREMLDEIMKEKIKKQREQESAKESDKSKK